MSDTPERPHNLATENENLAAGRGASPPRPETEPAGAEASQDSPKTATDPGSGASDGTPPAPPAGPDQS